VLDGPSFGRFDEIDRNVRPKSFDTNTYGLKSLRR